MRCNKRTVYEILRDLRLKTNSMESLDSDETQTPARWLLFGTQRELIKPQKRTKIARKFGTLSPLRSLVLGAC